MRALKVLILDEAFVSGAIAVLGLRRAGCDVTVLAATGGRGRCVSGASRWELGPALGDPRLPDAIADWAERSDVVYPVTEPLRAVAWNAGGRWSEKVFPGTSGQQRAIFECKRRMSAAVAAAGVPVPDEHDAREDAEVGAGARALGVPVVVKGSRGRGGAMTVIAGTSGEAIAAASRLRALMPEVFLQRYVAGPTYLAGGVFDDGRALRLYLARKTVQFPARTGPAAELLSVHDDALRSAALAAFSAARVTGIASADFIEDGRGDFRFIELNPRPWGSMAAAAAAGVDLFAPLVSLWRGERVAPRLEYRVGVRTATLPLYLLSPRMWASGRAAVAAPRDVARLLRFSMQEPGLAAHLTHRCLHAATNWSGAKAANVYNKPTPDSEDHAPSWSRLHRSRHRGVLLESVPRPGGGSNT